MATIRVLMVVDGIFNLSMNYPVAFTNQSYGPDAWFTISHLVKTLRASASPTFLVDTASRGFNAAGNEANNALVNSVPDPNATIQGAFRFDNPNINLANYDELWLFGFEGIDFGPFDLGPLTFIADTELAAITQFMEGGGGVFAAGDHDGLGSNMCGRIPRVRYMRKWFYSGDTRPGRPPLAQDNWPGAGATRADTLIRGVADPPHQNNVNDTFYFDDQSDDLPQQLTVTVPTHLAVQGKTGVLKVFPDHMHEGEVLIPSGAQLAGTHQDADLAFTAPGFVEFPTAGGHQTLPILLATCQVGAHITKVDQAVTCERSNFASTTDLSVPKTLQAIAAYDGYAVGVGRVVTDSSFHHYLDLNLLGDPCSSVAVKQSGFPGSANGRAVLAELEAYYVNLATWIARSPFKPAYQTSSGIGGYDLKSPADQSFAFDYDSSGNLDHLVLYRPGTGAIFILKRVGTNFTAVFIGGNPVTGVYTGIGGYDLKSPADRGFAFDYDGSGKLDHLVFYRPGAGAIFILKKVGTNFTAVFIGGNAVTGVYTGIGSYDLKSPADQGFAFDYDGSGKLDHLVFYRPGAGAIFILKRVGTNFTAVFIGGNPVTGVYTGIGGYDLKSPADRGFAFDYDGSGKLDHLVFYRPGTGAIFILKRVGTNFTAVFIGGNPVTGVYTGIGGYDLKSPADQGFAFDYDGSGKLDHLVFYRPGTGAIFILERVGTNFTAVFISGNPVIGVYDGIGGYDLKSSADRVFAFDYDSSGKEDYLVLFRPGAGTLWIERGI